MTFREFLESSVIEVYHRTRVADSNAFTEGFKPSRGILGKGIYTTYSLEDQIQPYMVKSYGNYVAFATCDCSKVLCLDPEMAMKIHGVKPLVKQLEKLGITDFRSGSKVRLGNRDIPFSALDKEKSGNPGVFHQMRYGQLDHGQDQKWWEKLLYGEKIPDLSIPEVRGFLRKYDGVIKGYLYKEGARRTVFVIDPSILKFEKLEYMPIASE